MHEEYWGFDFPPFDEGHAAQTYVESEQFALAAAKIRHIALRGQSAAAVVGAPGVGKTALAWHLVRGFETDGWAASCVVDPIVPESEVFARIAADLGGSGDTFHAAADAVGALSASGRPACIVVDEVHAVEDVRLLEHLRMLTNIEIRGRRPFLLLLVGQDGLVDRLHAASAFDQRLALTATVRAMSEDETKHYILARLKAAGCSRGIFTRTAAERICEFSAGVPRHVNRLCELSLLAAYGFEADKVRPDVVDMAARHLGLERDVDMLEGLDGADAPGDADVDSAGDVLAAIPPAAD